MPHPPLRLPSARLSQSSAPRTPSCGSPVQPPFFLPSNSNRKSSDSWTSSNFDPDELEWEWKPDQSLLLSRTLDALPAHLLTPFIGPVPPPNLLDKVARGVVKAKGPVDWPHSVRATRSKLIELSRQRAKEAQEEKRRNTIEEEDFLYDPDDFHPAVGRPLYRQSSMDFMQSARLDVGDTDAFSRAMHRLQRTERAIANPPYHLRPHSPETHSIYAHTLNPSTPSSTTLHSTRSARSSRSSLRRTASTLSNSSSDKHALPVYDPLAKTVRRTDSYGNLRQPLKRAPSYGVPVKRETHALQQRNSLTEPSSDEEEKVRTKTAKKPRKLSDSSPSSSTPTTSDSDLARKPPKAVSSTPKAALATGAPTAARLRANPQRNPSMLGPELLLHAQPAHEPAYMRTQIPSFFEPQPHAVLTSQSPQTPRSPRTPTRTLRRVRQTAFPPRAARRISFGGLLAPAEGDAPVLESLDAGEARGLGLGSAFQLR